MNAFARCFAATVITGAAGCSIVGVLRGQGATGELRSAIVDLASVDRQGDASSTLIRAGESAVPLLREVLRGVVERDEDTLRNTLFALGCIGRPAAAAAPELLHAYRMGLTPGVRREALWAIGQVVPFAARVHPPDEVMQFLQRHAAEGVDRFLFACVEARLALGAEPAPEKIIDVMREQDLARVIATADAVAGMSQVELAGEGMRDALAALEALLATVLERPEHPWDALRPREVVTGAVAAALWRAGMLGPLVGRGLLQHWNPELRKAGLGELHDGSRLSLGERLDVVMVLRDRDPRVRDLALATLRGWGDGLAMALPVLIGAQRGDDRAFAAAARVAVDRLLVELGRERPRAATIVAAACSALRGEPGAAPDGPGADDCAELAAMVFGCRGLAGDELRTLALFVHERGLAHRNVVEAFVACLGATDAAAWRAALDALTRIGPPVVAVCPDIASFVIRSTPLGVWKVAPLAEAWIAAGKAATVDELERAIDSEQWTVAQRAMVEFVQRGGVPAAAAVRAALGVPARKWTDVFVTQGEAWSERRGRGYAYVTMPVPFDTLSSACCLLLLAADDERWRGPDLLVACARTFRVPEENVAEHLRVAKANGGLAEMATQLDAALLHEDIPTSKSR